MPLLISRLFCCSAVAFDIYNPCETWAGSTLRIAFLRKAVSNASLERRTHCDRLCLPWKQSQFPTASPRTSFRNLQTPPNLLLPSSDLAENVGYRIIDWSEQIFSSWTNGTDVAVMLEEQKATLQSYSCRTRPLLTNTTTPCKSVSPEKCGPGNSHKCNEFLWFASIQLRAVYFRYI